MIEKIDIINQIVYCYDSQYQLTNTVELNSLENTDLPYYMDCKLYTINVTTPIKRVVNFQELNGLNSNAQFVEYLYDDMNSNDKMNLDLFINEVENL